MLAGFNNGSVCLQLFDKSGEGSQLKFVGFI